MTETLTPEQRLEVRRTLLQSIAELQRGLTLAGMQLKKGLFTGAKDTITGTEAMLILHEGMARLLLKENQHPLESAAEEMEAVIHAGDVAEVAAPVEGERGRAEAVAARDELYEDPAGWLRAYIAKDQA